MNILTALRKIRSCEGEAAAQLVLEHFVAQNVEALCKALEFYSEEQNYKSIRTNDGNGHFDRTPSNIEHDNGETARAALKCSPFSPL